ncbi:MAG: hypothetical protein U5L74_14520, partial [Ideonella sp.]|nr:hypothetical protein [Ideonella sp.]
IDASAPTPVSISITAVNAANQLVSNAPVALSVDAGGLITAAAAKTDGSGVLQGTLELGNDRRVRPLTITAISGAIAKSIVVSVVEGSPSAAVAELRVTAATSTISNKAPAPVEVTVQAVNANNLPVSGAPVTVRADQGGVVTAGAATTSAAGTLTVTLGMGADTTPRTITLTATSGTKTGTGTVTVVDGFSAGVCVDCRNLECHHRVQHSALNGHRHALGCSRALPCQMLWSPSAAKVDWVDSVQPVP